jgi:MarC family membrane protein
MLDYTEYTKLLIGLLAIINPLGSVPIFVALTPEATQAERMKIIRVALLAVAIILLVSLFLGQAILDFFGITISSFRVGGGILILLMAVAMLQAKVSPAAHTEAELETGESVAVVPLAIPLLAGPGAISTVILYAHRGHGTLHYALASLDILVVVLILGLVFLLVPWITRYVSQTGINIFTRIMGLILAAIAVEFIANGLKGLFPALAQ